MSSSSNSIASGNGREQAGITTFQRMLSACSGSLINSLVATPFDVIRVRLQLQECVPVNSSPLKSYSLPETNVAKLATADLGVKTCCREVFSMPSSVDYCVASHFDECAVQQYSQRQLFRGTWDGFVKITRNEGITALWRGLSPTLVMTIPSNVIYFVGYDYLRQVIPIHSSTLAPLVAGGFARMLSTTAVSPFELFRTRLQSVASSSHQSMSSREAFVMTWDGVKVMVRERGIGTLWRGLALTLWRDVPFSAVYWTGYEKSRQVLDLYNDGRTLGEVETFAQAFAAGAVSGSFAAFVTTPFDVGKTRRQVLRNRDPAMDSMLMLLRKIATEEGVSGLFRGLGPRMMKVSVSCAIMISFYEVGKRISMRSNEKSLQSPTFSPQEQEDEILMASTAD
ncbi:mitochondrial carrier domain-containing protein [Lipomyces kononenkoae]|uniref:Mitochondrial carrier domain-containing protein n=1 Tax=Lipomyces kononenkoae TaxID=34357 RepID=A0ACC3STV5_LIPKO